MTPAEQRFPGFSPQRAERAYRAWLRTDGERFIHTLAMTEDFGERELSQTPDNKSSRLRLAKRRALKPRNQVGAA